jgi:hypothetical protein
MVSWRRRGIPRRGAVVGCYGRVRGAPLRSTAAQRAVRRSPTNSNRRVHGNLGAVTRQRACTEAPAPHGPPARSTACPRPWRDRGATVARAPSIDSARRPSAMPSGSPRRGGRTLRARPPCGACWRSGGRRSVAGRRVSRCVRREGSRSGRPRCRGVRTRCVRHRAKSRDLIRSGVSRRDRAKSPRAR